MLAIFVGGVADGERVHLSEPIPIYRWPTQSPLRSVDYRLQLATSDSSMLIYSCLKPRETQDELIRRYGQCTSPTN